MCPLRVFFALLQLHLLCVLGLGGYASSAGSARATGRNCPFRGWAVGKTSANTATSSCAFVAPSPLSRSSAALSLTTSEVAGPSSEGGFRTSTGLFVAPTTGHTAHSLSRRRRVGPALKPLYAATVAAPTASIPADAIAAAAEKKEKEANKKKRKATSMTPLEVHVIGLSHHNAAVEVREKLSIPEAQWNEAANKLCGSGVIAEACTLSTCNRFEIYFAAHDSYAAFHEATAFLERHSGLPQSVLRKNLFLLSGEDAIWHLMRVSGGLDSLVVGEGQILSQVKQCYNHGMEEDGKGGKVISRMLNSAVAAGKRVRSETGISKGAVSISSAAVEFSQLRCPKDLGKPFEDSRVAIVGAGKMSRLLMIHMASQGVKAVTLMNRGRERAETLAAEFPEMEVAVRLMDDLWPVMHSHDVVYTSTSAQGCLLTKENIQASGLAPGKVIVDISVPRNVETEVSEIEGMFAYNVDHLKEVVDRNTAMRKKQMLEAEDLLVEEMEKFRSWQFSLGAVPALMKLQEKAETMRMEELKKASKKLNNLSEKELQTVERLTKGIVNKLLHGPMSHLRATEDLEKNLVALKTLKAVFEL
ncbi:hypothetical protein NSK_003180 [Nannochloropsis salina CCMP1776]|uniref:Glutamyl-tRNA reductase n=1 Tax=Nannochloropsis salina CCMP1776 TaxID=1027361 RepID=A0A4D9D291_9STRA|nr:hypothetical protein NSK_003180 [Nannochloropsis salina CCMP1776]|eukprot:TFJ85672.1 hypothetical protein NSK_003180 [Nannochloropsis salina CCMP1776]